MMFRRFIQILPAVLAAPFCAGPAFADEIPSPSNARDSDIVVTGMLVANSGLLAGASVLEGTELISAMRGQPGDMLDGLPGVSSSGFAPGVSRPILRGLDGDRVRVLVDGIGSIDASTVSADHAVVIDPMTTDHIDIVHGPAALLFGGQAIGGAVNVVDMRIPRQVLPEPSYRLVAGYGSGSDERSAAFRIQAPLGNSFAISADASWRKAGDRRVPGFVVEPDLRADLFAQAAVLRGAGDIAEADELEAQANQRGRVVNSAFHTVALGAGLAYISSGGSLGVSVQRFDTDYGVPGRPGTGDGAGVSIDLGQTRVDLRADVKLSGLFKSLQFRGGVGNYRHAELEDGVPGTTFSGNGYEVRAELIQAEQNGWRGQSGVQARYRNMRVVGAEAVTPDNRSYSIGFFTLQSFKLGAGFELDLSGRFENARVSSPALAQARTFDLWSGAAGASWQDGNGLKAGANFVHGARAPAPEELLSDGAHAATQSYEIGDPNFETEKSNGAELYLKLDKDHFSASFTAFVTKFSNYIVANPTGAVQDDLPVYAYEQKAATFKGLEASAQATLAKLGKGTLKADVAMDYVHASLAGGEPLPRIPPFNAKLGVSFDLTRFMVRGELEYAARQNRIAPLERPTPSSTQLNLAARWKPFKANDRVNLLLSARNITNAQVRNATSFTREFVPGAGRDIRLTLDAAF